jgi:glycosyltransferase involved in cell wall biosynthesis
MNASSSLSVAVVVPCYNGASVLSRTLTALLAQTRVPDEIVVVDDGSTDDSSEVAQSFGAPVRVVSQANAGAAAARCRGVKEARSDIIAFNDCGDVSRPQRIEKLLDGLAAHPQCVVAFSSTWVKGRPEPTTSRITGRAFDDSYLVIDDPLNRMLTQAFPLAIAMNLAMRRAVALQSADVPRFYKAANDYALQMRAATHGPWVHVATLSMEYEVTPGGLTRTNGWMQQTGYALLAALEIYDAMRDRVHINEAAFQDRVEMGWPGIALHMHLRRNYPVMRRVIAGGLRIGRWHKVPRRLWWAIDRAEAEGDLQNAPLLRGLARVVNHLRGQRSRASA